MRYIQNSNTTYLTPSDWVSQGGNLLNLPEKIAEQGGFLALDEKKERKIALIALNYAKQRRQRSLLTLQREIANLDDAIKRL